MTRDSEERYIDNVIADIEADLGASVIEINDGPNAVEIIFDNAQAYYEYDFEEVAMDVEGYGFIRSVEAHEVESYVVSLIIHW